MPDGIYAGYAGALAAQADVEVIANNVANAATAGYRRDLTLFDTVYGNALGYARAQASALDLGPGSERITGDRLHAALRGDGFFVVRDPAGGELYTRRGDFGINASGQLSLPNGEAVLGQGGELVVPPGTRPHLDDRGVLRDEAGGVLGRLRVVRFPDPSGLEKLGGSLLRVDPLAAAPDDVADPRIAPGSVEDANVNLAAELVQLIQAQRAFEAAMRSLQTADELNQSLIQAQAGS